MGLFKIAFFLLLYSVGIKADQPIRGNPAHIFYLIHTNKLDQALEHCQDYLYSNGRYDTEFLQQLGLSVLEQGAKSCDPDIHLMTLFGAGISMNEKAMDILMRGIESSHLHLQLIALNFLARAQNDQADSCLLSALRSSYLLVRLEAAHQIALKKHPQAAHLVESLMGKVPVELMPLFPQLFAAIGNADAIRILKRLLAHPLEDVRIAAILSTAKANRDDLLPKIKILAMQPSYKQQEACAYAFGLLNDESAIPYLEKLAQSGMSQVQLAALQALQKFGRTEAQAQIGALASKGDLFAIAALGEIAGSEAILWQLVNHQNLQISINAAIGLLKLSDPRCQPFLNSIFIRDSRDLAFINVESQGRSLSYWKVVPSARQNFEEFSIDLELSQHFRESVLKDAVNLPGDNFYSIVKIIFEKQQNDLVPAAISLIENMHTDFALNLLKRYQQHAGAPFIRNYCNLALYRLQEEGPYGENLRKWVAQQTDAELIQLRPYIPWEVDNTIINYQINPHETSNLLVEAFEAFAQQQDNDGINALLDAVRKGNSKNRYALAGLLMRASL